MKNSDKRKPLVSKRFLTVLMSLCFALPLSVSGQTTGKAPSAAPPLKDRVISINIKNGTLDDVLRSIKKSTNCMLFYNSETAMSIQNLNVSFTSATVDQILSAALRNTSLKHTYSDNTIIISVNDQAPSNRQRVTGVVIDQATRQPVVGATVLLVGTNQGAITNQKGEFSLEIPVTGTEQIQVSYIGKETRIIPVKTLATQKTIELADQVGSIDEVVVTGYANIRKEGFTGSATTVSKTDLLKVSPQNVMKALSVFDPSIKMIQNNEMGSNPNNISEYYIRGRSGVSEVKELDLATSDDVSEFSLKNNPSTPIFIVDGFEVDMEYVYDMDINRIESITILKDAVATAVYGSRAGNGVIVIETTAPLPGEIRISYNATASLTVPDLSSYSLLNSQEALEAEWYAGLFESTSDDKNAGGLVNYGSLYNNVTRGVNTDWISKPLQNEFNHKHYLYITGGSEELRWGVDLNYQRRGGVMKESWHNTYGAAMTVDYRHKAFQIKNKAYVNIMDEQESPYGSFSDYVRMKPYLDPIDPETGSYYKIFSIYRNIRSSISLPVEITNPLYEATLNSFDKSKYREFIDNLSLNWNINSHWLFKGTFGISYKVQDDDVFVDPSSGVYSSTEVNERGSYKQNNIRTSKWNLNGLLAYNQSIGKHYLNFAMGVEASETKSNAMYATYRGFVEGAVPSPSNALDIYNKPTFQDSNSRRFGTYLQFNYTFNNIYLFDVAGRYEGSSAFGANKKMGTFWSFGTGINVHNYDFMSDAKWLDRLKLKATYGQTGKANFSPYQARTMYEILFDAPYIDGWGMTLKALGNEDLRWEKVNKLDVGAEISLLKNKFTVIFDYYQEKTIDQVEDVSIPSSSGFKSYKGNVGEVMNKGFDLLVNANIFTNKDWSVYFFGNLNHNRNTITKIGTALKDYNDRIDEFFSGYNSSDSKYSQPFTKYEVGNSLTAIYGMKSLGIDPANGDEIYVKRDGTLTYTWSSSEQQCLGDYEPKASGVFGFNVRWKNWMLYTTFAYRWGGQAYNNTLVSIENVDLTRYSGDRRILTERWKEVGEQTILKNIQDRTLVTRPTSRFVQNDNQLVFNSISLNYEFDHDLVKKWGMSSVRLQFNMEDLATFSSIRQERGTSYPYARTFNFSLNITL